MFALKHVRVMPIYSDFIYKLMKPYNYFVVEVNLISMQTFSNSTYYQLCSSGSRERERERDICSYEFVQPFFSLLLLF
jgi:hypothetical protein